MIAKMFSNPDSQHILSVTKLNRFAKMVLESEIGLVWVVGEISNFVAASSGHWYLSLKDNKAQVRAAMFRGANRSVNFTPKNGDKVMVRASLSIYEARGDYQLIVQHMELDGQGQLKQQFDLLKQKLNAEGLFDQAIKKPLPEKIKRIGVITSPTGAAIHDILQVLMRRNPALEVILYPSAVQGDLAASEICRQLDIANKRKEVDALIVGRGGGSLEDLWAFNEELVARAIFASDLFVVSAVGHETDVTIADFVADQRAPTPSAAAELLSEDKVHLYARINELRTRLLRQTKVNLSNYRYQQNLIDNRINTNKPQSLIESYSQHLDSLIARLRACHPSREFEQQKAQLNKNIKSLFFIQKQLIEKASKATQTMQHRLTQCNPSPRITDAKVVVQTAYKQLYKRVNDNLHKAEQDLAKQSAILDTVSPLNTLKRGYSISFEHGEIVRSVEQLDKNTELEIKFADGRVNAKVQKVVKNP